MKFNRPLTGIIPPILTPLEDRDQLDSIAFDSNGVYRAGAPESSYLRGLKCAASMLGFGNGLMAEPYLALRHEERSGIRAALEQVGLLKPMVAR